LALGSSLGLGSASLAQSSNQSLAVTTPAHRLMPSAKYGPLQMMQQSLNLTDEQVQKLEPVMKAQQAKVAALRSDSTLSRQERAAKFKQIGKEGNAKFNA